MPKVVIMNSLDELPEFFANIYEDFGQIDYGVFLAGELDILADLHRDMFQNSQSPDGAPWKPNAPSTIRQKGHAIILRGKRNTTPSRNVKATKRRPAVRHNKSKGIRGFRLATSLTAKTKQSFGDAVREAIGRPGGGDATFGTSVEYSIYNDQGTSRIPARPHIGMTEQQLDAIVGRALDYSLQQLAKA